MALLVREKKSGELLEYYYIQDNNMICVKVLEEDGEWEGSFSADFYADSKNLTLFGVSKGFIFREDGFLEVLTEQYESGQRLNE